jgi:hypothetical protein
MLEAGPEKAVKTGGRRDGFCNKPCSSAGRHVPRDPKRGLRSVRHVYLSEDPVKVCPHRVLNYEKFVRDMLVAGPGSEARQDLLFPPCQMRLFLVPGYKSLGIFQYVFSHGFSGVPQVSRTALWRGFYGLQVMRHMPVGVSHRIPINMIC